jgi:hypothetical protein
MLKKNNRLSPTNKSIEGMGINAFLSSIAIFLSAIALGITGFAIVQNFQLQQSFNQLNVSMQKSLVTSEPSPVHNSTLESPPADNTATTPPSQQTQQVNKAIQPGQFVRPAFGGKAEVELLAVKRIQNPETGKRDVVNVQMRFRRLKVRSGGSIILNHTKARNPDTSQTYESYNEVVEDEERERARREGTEIDRSRIKRSTGNIMMRYDVPQGGSSDGYVWMSIPEGINKIDLLVDDTEAFLNVPISE